MRTSVDSQRATFTRPKCTDPTSLASSLITPTGCSV
jgi:hypothetical protein